MRNSPKAKDDSGLALTEVAAVLYTAMMKACASDGDLERANSMITAALINRGVTHPNTARALLAALRGSQMGLEPQEPKPKATGNVVPFPLAPTHA
jgi:pentatricopeptide repeat protein